MANYFGKYLIYTSISGSVVGMGYGMYESLWEQRYCNNNLGIKVTNCILPTIVGGISGAVLGPFTLGLAPAAYIMQQNIENEMKKNKLL